MMKWILGSPSSGQNVVKYPLGCPFRGQNKNNVPSRVPSSWQNVVKCPFRVPSSGQNEIKCLQQYLFIGQTVKCPLGSLFCAKSGKLSSRMPFPRTKCSYVPHNFLHTGAPLHTTSALFTLCLPLKHPESARGREWILDVLIAESWLWSCIWLQGFEKSSSAGQRGVKLNDWVWSVREEEEWRAGQGRRSEVNSSYKCYYTGHSNTPDWNISINT